MNGVPTEAFLATGLLCSAAFTLKKFTGGVQPFKVDEKPKDVSNHFFAVAEAEKHLEKLQTFVSDLPAQSTKKESLQKVVTTMIEAKGASLSTLCSVVVMLMMCWRGARLRPTANQTDGRNTRTWTPSHLVFCVRIPVGDFPLIWCIC